MDYKSTAQKCLKSETLPMFMKWFEDSHYDFDIFCEKYKNTECTFARVIEKGHIYEIGYHRCLCPKAQGGVVEKNFCECSRQGIIYILENLIPKRKFTVKIIETVLFGGKKCVFRIEFND